MSQFYEYTYSSGGSGEYALGDAYYTTRLAGSNVAYSNQSSALGTAAVGRSTSQLYSFGGAASGNDSFTAANSASQFIPVANRQSSRAVLFETSGLGSSHGAHATALQDLHTSNAKLHSGNGYNASTTYISSASNGASHSGGIIEASAYSAIEQAILSASNPIQLTESELITVNGHTGVWANKQEVISWRGAIPITQYLINEDVNPEVIRKRTEQQILYEQEIAIRYLRPPTPPPPGEILIRQEKNYPTPPAPPLVIRQQPPRPETPAPLVIREAPPRPPAAIGAKVVTISGKRLPPPPRKVVIERLAPLPSKPQSIFIERWLPYSDPKRRVIFQRNTVPDPIIPKPRNVIIQWESPSVVVKKDFKDLGIIRANPVDYVQRYGNSLKVSSELPSFVIDIKPPTGLTLAADYIAPSLIELEGDIHALNLIDLEQWGLSEYIGYLNRPASVIASSLNLTAAQTAYFQKLLSVTAIQVANAVLAEFFALIDRNNEGYGSIEDCERILVKLNKRLGRVDFGERDVKLFFESLKNTRNGKVDLEEFKSSVLKGFTIV